MQAERPDSRTKTALCHVVQVKSRKFNSTFWFTSATVWCIWVYSRSNTYGVSQEECAILRESVPYVKLYRYNPNHLYPKLNGYGDNGQRVSKVWQLLYTYWLPNKYWNMQEYVVSVMLISVLNIKLTCEWHKATKLNHNNTRTHITVLPSTVHIGSNEMVSYRVGRSLCRQRNAYRIAISRSMRYTAVDVQYAEMQDVHTFLWPFSP